MWPREGDKTQVKQGPGHHPPGQEDWSFSGYTEKELEIRESLPSVSHVMEQPGCSGKWGLTATVMLVSAVASVTELPWKSAFQGVGGLAMRPAQSKGRSSGWYRNAHFRQRKKGLGEKV